MSQDNLQLSESIDNQGLVGGIAENVLESESMLCAGDGDYTKWDCRLASQRIADRKRIDHKPVRRIAHCPSEAISFNEDDENFMD